MLDGWETVEVTRESVESCIHQSLAPFFTSGYNRPAMPQTSHDEGDRQAYRYASLGMQFAGGTLLFAGLGFLLDRWLHILPALTVTGVLVGGGLSFYSIYRKVLADQAADKAAKDRTGR